MNGLDPEQVADLFAEAVERPAEERPAFLDSRCGGSAAMRAEIDSLLAAHEELHEDARARGGLGAALLAQVAEAETADRRIGPYRLLRELGRGGMGVVYLAERVEGGFRQRVAIKLLKLGMDSDAILQRFLRERQILAGLDHPNVARLIDGGLTEEGRPYFAMELVEGEPLTTYCASRKLDLPERLGLFEVVCRAVQYAHGRLVIHRDLKPSNLLVSAEGRLKLLDFGIAKLLGDGEEGEVAGSLTETGLLPLTPQYAAPEQIRGEQVTTSTDVYALGLVAYELLTGRLPYGGDGHNREDLARAVCEVDPPPPSQTPIVSIPRALRRDLDAVVLKALRKEPRRRYGSAEALAEDVRRCLTGQPVQARPDSVRYRAAKFVRRHKVGVGAAVAAMLSLLVGLIGIGWQRDRARLEAARAERVREFLIGVFKASDPAEAEGKEITARELLERGTERIEKELAGQPAEQAELLHTMSVSFRGLGRYDRARALEERSLEIFRGLYGPEHVLVARGLGTLAVILSSQGEYVAAEDSNRQALAMLRRLLPADDPKVVARMEDLADLLTSRTKLEEAETLVREVLAIRRRRLGPDHSETASSVASLAFLLYSKGEFAAAAEHYREALRVQRGRSGDLHPEVATSLSSLGASLLSRGDALGAEAAHREALSIRRRLFGEEHPSVSMSLHHLAATLQSKGDLPGAEGLYRQALAADRKILGEEHPKIAVTLGNLASAVAEQERYAEAMALFDQAIALQRRGNDEDHPRLARTLERKASALIAKGEPSTALVLLEEALAIYRARSGPDHPSVAGALVDVAACRAELGEAAEAERLYREALDLQRRAFSRGHYAIVATLMSFGELLTRLDRADEAEPLLREALEQAGQVLPAGHWRRGDVESALGACLLKLGRREEAAALLRSGYDRCRRALGDAHPATARSRRRLAEL
jgi:eukaryotic-like serine/threonine-protein kinase